MSLNVRQPPAPQEEEVTSPKLALTPVRPVTLRALLIGLVCVPINTLWVISMERVDGRVFSSTCSLFFTAVFFLLALVTLNRLVLARLAPRKVMRQGELLTIFSMISISTAMCAVDFMSPLITLMGHATWFSTPSNEWEKFFSSLPSWLTVSDREVLRGYYVGNSSLYTPQHLRAWLIPSFFWGLFIFALLWTMACLNTLVRAQWTEKERLSYPLVQLPLAMTTEEGSLFKSKIFWFGFAVAASLEIINGLHSLFPSIPALTFNGLDANLFFTQKPWSAIGWTPLAIFPFIVGIGYLLPADLLFSCWFFFFYWKLERVMSSAFGYLETNPRSPYIDEQMFGGYVAVAVFAVWSMRSQLRDIWRKAFGKRNASTLDDSQEPMTYRKAFLGAAGGFVFLVGFSMAAKMPAWVAVLFFLLYFVIALSVTRMRAELGPPAHDLHFIGPNQSLFSIFGSQNLSQNAMGVMTLYYWFNRAYRGHAMPHQLEAFKMGKESGTNLRGTLFAVTLASVVAIAATFWVTLHLSYQLGAAGKVHGWASLGYGNEAFDKLSSWISTPTKPDVPAMQSMTLGFAITAVLTLLRMRVLGFPFHPLGFCLSGGWSMWWMWLSLMIAWIFKVSILRFGGLKLYKAALPFFFGIILGDFLIGGVWTLLGLFYGIPIYSVWSG